MTEQGANDESKGQTQHWTPIDTHIDCILRWAISVSPKWNEKQPNPVRSFGGRSFLPTQLAHMLVYHNGITRQASSRGIIIVSQKG
jgi:hypothetical protein